jgi:hypothetical protein
MKFLVPKGTPGITFAGIEIKAASDGSIEVPEPAVEAALSFGFMPWQENAPNIQPDPNRTSETPLDPATVTSDLIDGLSRPQLFEFLKDKGIATGATTTNEVLKMLARQAISGGQPKPAMPNLQVKA